MTYPLLFEMDPVAADWGSHAKKTIRVAMRMPATPEVVFEHVVRLQRAEAWLYYFRSVSFRNEQRIGAGTTADENFTFMTMRVQTLTEEPGMLWIARTDACSIPLGRRMLQHITFDADGDHTNLEWLIHYDPPKLLSLFNPIVQPFFRRMFTRSCKKLATLL